MMQHSYKHLRRKCGFSSRFSMACCFLGAVLFSANAYTDTASKSITGIAYVSIGDDAHYQAPRLYSGLSLNTPQPAIAGARLAMREARIVGRSLGIQFTLDEHVLPTEHDKASLALAEYIDARPDGTFMILDVPKALFTDTVARFADRKVVFFNARFTDNDLRGELCSARLFHTMPSQSMLDEAIAQYLRSRKWMRVLMLEGPEPEDKALARSFAQAADKLGLSIVARKPFVAGNDPRRREQRLVGLLSAVDDHDVVFIADAVGDFARYVPYQTRSARPVIGSEGLRASAWHWTWERHGAPQLNQRFAKFSDGKQMSDEPWAGWAAVKSVVSAYTLASKNSEGVNFEQLHEALLSQQLTLDLYKGNPGNYRRWNHQLRQPLLLHTHNAVIARAPIHGFIHQYNDLDTLGVDEPESPCK